VLKVSHPIVGIHQILHSSCAFWTQTMRQRGN